jgi:phosphoribosylanthranilate isomerase
MTVAVKICGLTSEQAVRATIADRASFAGFVYFPASPRHLELPRASSLRALLPPNLPAVSVLVDADDALIGNIISTVKPDYLQLHGKETPERVRVIKSKFPGIKLIKAVSVSASDDVARALGYDAADMLLFDARPPELPGMLPGGNGLSFDWQLLKNRQFPKPWMLSGGLNADNVAEAVRLSGAAAVDVSSSIESSPGVKDPDLIHAFINAARAA